MFKSTQNFNLILSTLCLLFFKSSFAVDWYNLLPYNTTTCTSGTMYGLGYSFIGNASYCTANIEGTLHSATSFVNNLVKVQFYSNWAPKVCANPSLASNYQLNTCQDSQLQGFNMNPNGLWYTKNFYVNKTTSPVYPTTGTLKTNMLFTMYDLTCTSITSYAYFIGHTVIHDPNDSNIYYNYYCQNGIPYREYCELEWGCDSTPQDLTQNCSSNFSYFIARSVRCV
ncbi:hypothetical protein DLAC_04787 [Tieghemostelium lacteum]|uniref:Uncharacterized protein n=1 Tax=Tieghemostelium lacteum TaxID=361077 RepID=A0A151ZKI0_TIELA|nr:hypothetical protein DLAC_04787 [Tieghemostelium lacteum]|eukprot:KYQ94483.1 hypothetical protein DLAC_04787 [Tieghemostelium lacteum]